MRLGRHFAQFTVLVGINMFFGVIRSGWDVEGGANAYDVDGHCFYRTYGGHRYLGAIDWEGMQTARQQGDRISMLLDLDQGSMTVWKNDVKLGVMAAEGMRGPLCWAATMYRSSESVRIDSAVAPPSLTEEELLAVKAREQAAAAAAAAAAEDYW